MWKQRASLVPPQKKKKGQTAGHVRAECSAIVFVPCPGIMRHRPALGNNPHPGWVVEKSGNSSPAIQLEKSS